MSVPRLVSRSRTSGREAGRGRLGLPHGEATEDSDYSPLGCRPPRGLRTRGRRFAYRAFLRRLYLSGGAAIGPMSSYLLEAAKLEDPWHIVSYLGHFGTQGYFLSFPSRFISDDGRLAWLVTQLSSRALV